MEANARWEQRYKTFYDAYYYELLSASIINRWQRIDFVVSLLVALTTSGSAFAGLGYWNTDWGKPVWACLAAIATFASIAHGVARVSAHLQQQGEARRDFSLLRGRLQAVLYKMLTIGDVPELEAEFEPLLGRLVELESKLNPDLISGPKLEIYVQRQLNGILDRLGFNEKGIMKFDGGKTDEEVPKLTVE